MKPGASLQKIVNQRSLHGEVIETVDAQIDEGPVKHTVLYLMWSNVSEVINEAARTPIDIRLFRTIGWDSDWDPGWIGRG
jgi:hypothetical protein